MKEILKSIIKKTYFFNYLRKYSKSYKKFGRPREFSNLELKKYAELFSGDIVNVSGWNDSDKQGSFYSNYFSNSGNYKISNYKEDQKGLQGLKNEFYLDLEANLDNSLKNKFDVVFCHTVLEHVYNFQKAFENLSEMSKDILIIIVPFLQQVHGSGYKDYWRFSPESIKRMYLENGFIPRYISANCNDKASIYIFSIGFKDKKWENKIPEKFVDRIDNKLGLSAKNYSNALGAKVI